MSKKETRGRPRIYKESVTLTLRVEHADRAKWEAHAKAQNMNLNALVNKALNDTTSDSKSGV